ncbi:MAG: hypothetical protein ACKO96_05010 [Flammeovirgaceae bacterium]
MTEKEILKSIKKTKETLEKAIGKQKKWEKSYNKKSSEIDKEISDLKRQIAYLYELIKK